MRVKKGNRYFCESWQVISLCLCLFLFAACENPADKNAKADDTTKTEPGDQTEKTWVEFTNLEQFPVTVYSDSSRQQKMAEVAANGRQKIPASPTPAGTAFYPTFHLDLFDMPGISIPYNGPAIITAIKVDMTNPVFIPKLESVEINAAYITITNNSIYSLAFRQGDAEKSPLGDSSTIIVNKSTAVYEINPGPVSGYSAMRNTTIPLAFPEDLNEFDPGFIYTFNYDGSSLRLTETKSILRTIIPPSIAVQGNNLTLKLAWLQNNAASNTQYLVEVNADESIAPQTLGYNGKTGISITLEGTGGVMRTVDLSANGVLFTIGSGVTLILDNNITLKGRSGNTSSVIEVNLEGTLIMNEETKITGNIKSVSAGSAVSAYGGGVYNRGAFTMNGGEISGNNVTAAITSGTRALIISPTAVASGGGLYNDGTFTMNGGKISSNTVTASDSTSGGGLYNGGIFTMNGGKISGNTASVSKSSNGGGVYNSGYFTMNDGEISGNNVTASNSSGGNINLSRAAILPPKPTYTASGGGVYSSGSYSFRMSGGVIYGSNAATGLKNTASSSGASLLCGTAAQYGGFSGDTFIRSGDLVTSNNTIRIVNGNLQNN